MKTAARVMFYFLLAVVDSHPQCLDAKPPFHAKPPPQFCPQYCDFGCCTKARDGDIKKRFEEVRSNLSLNAWNRCSRILKELMCQECSPYSAHIYGVEEEVAGKGLFPGLCKNYCEKLFDQNCMELVPLFDSDLVPESDLNIKDKFCDHVKNSDTDYCYPELLDSPVLNNNVSNKQITAEGCLCLQQYFNNIKNPLFARNCPDGSNRIMIGEQIGVILVGFLDTKEILSTPFLDVSSEVKTSGTEGDERGLLQVAFHPKFTENKKFYVFYSTHLNTAEEVITTPDGSPWNHKSRISEFQVSDNDLNVADPTSERIILEILQPYANHNGGEMIFDDDGYLYIFTGDGGFKEDPLNFAQDRSVLLGKVLRIDVDTNDANIPYLIPRDNPYLGMEGIREEIYSYGVRNIWRCGKDLGDRETGDGKGRIICGDVGQEKFEELNLIKKGANYGWNIWEATSCVHNDMERCNQNGPLEKPIYHYPHSIGKSVTGGEFYRGYQNPNLNGLYIYGDYSNGRLFGLRQSSATEEWINKELFMCGPDYCKNDLTGSYDQHILAFDQDSQGEIYMLTTKKSTTIGETGNIYKLIDPVGYVRGRI